MRRKISIIVIATFLLAFSSWCFAQEDIDIGVPINNITIGNNSYFPIRGLFEALDFLVKWLDNEKAVLLYKEEDFIKLFLDDNYFIFNGELIEYNIKPVIHKNKFYVGSDFLEKVFRNFEYDYKGKTLVFKNSNMFRRIDKLPTIDSKEKLNKLLSYSNEKPTRYSNTDIVLRLPLEKKKSYNTIQSQVNKSLETNTQVRGVDEADIVKTDGSYIYILSKNNLYIVNSDSKDFSISHTLKFDNYKPLEFYIKDNKLVTIGYYRDYTTNKADKKSEKSLKNNILPSYPERLKIIIYNINDKKSPLLIREIEVDGHYLSSRFIDDYLYLVSNKSIYLGSQNLRPYYKDSSNNKKVLIDYKDIKYFTESMYDKYLITVGIDLKNLEASNINVNAYLGSGNNMYASNENMYITQNKYKYNIYDSNQSSYSDPTSSIYKFNLDGGKIKYLTKGEVPGRILNQFSMDEYKGNFRIVTTKDNLALDSESKSKNNVYIMDQKLKLLGKTKDLAPGETIYSVRFVEDKVYVVTFRDVNPFYVIDLKEPKSPKVLGCLKIPGYSSYLHPYDENHIIGIGMITSEKNGNVINEGIKISMFDVTDYSNPIELDKLIIGKQNSYTDILRNHKALLLSKERNILAFPIYVSHYSKSKHQSIFETQRAFIFSIDENYKLNLRGSITHVDAVNEYSHYIKRVIFIGNNLYTISDIKIKIWDYNNLEGIKELRLEVTN